MLIRYCVDSWILFVFTVHPTVCWLPQLSFAATSCLAVFLSMLLSLKYKTDSESEQEEELDELVNILVRGQAV